MVSTLVFERMLKYEYWKSTSKQVMTGVAGGMGAKLSFESSSWIPPAVGILLLIALLAYFNQGMDNRERVSHWLAVKFTKKGQDREREYWSEGPAS